MARSSEKAMAILSRWTAMKNAEGKPMVDTKRPYLATECDNVKDCNRWRKQILGEITKKVMAIQNAGMGEFRLRDLNDEINKLLREKRHWEDRILELGGPDYAKVGPKMLDADGKELPGNRGYKYFGAAKDLPGVRELFAQDPPKVPRKTRFELYKNIDADYYGYRDDDDGVLIGLEKEMESNVRSEAIAEWKDKVTSGEITVDEEDLEKNRYLVGDGDEEGEGEGEEGAGEGSSEHFISHVPVPTQKEVEDILLKRKKQELMDRYASDLLQSQSTQAKTLLGDSKYIFDRKQPNRMWGAETLSNIPWSMIVGPLVTLFAGNLILGIVVQIFGKKDNSWIDSWWSMSFLLPNIVILAIKGATGYPINARNYLITACVAVWALRLSIYITWRHKKEDYRYKEMRESWSAQSTCTYYTKAFVFIYIGQGFFSFINNGSVLFTNVWSSGVIVGGILQPDNKLGALDYVGLAIWVLGFLCEVVADRQLANHLANPQPGTGKFIKSGLWRYSRHPNYFGEAVMWWGIWIISISVKYGFATVYAPIFITVFLRFVSGVPFPEKKYKDNPEWKQYCKETNIFCLWFAKTNESEPIISNESSSA